MCICLCVCVPCVMRMVFAQVLLDVVKRFVASHWGCREVFFLTMSATIVTSESRMEINATEGSRLSIEIVTKMSKAK